MHCLCLIIIFTRAQSVLMAPQHSSILIKLDIKSRLSVLTLFQLRLKFMSFDENKKQTWTKIWKKKCSTSNLMSVNEKLSRVSIQSLSM